MTKTNDLALAFVKQVQQRPSNASRPPINAFHSLFEIADLNEEEQKIIEGFLIDPKNEADDSLEIDLFDLKRITKEVKAIKRQEMLLIGERIFAAREIFKRHKEKNFREWMSFTFGSFKTGYNYLSFYDLYTELPEELKIPFKEMPAKAAYILASKKVPIEKKAEIIENHAKDSAHSIIASIQNSIGKESPSIYSEIDLDRELRILERHFDKILQISETINSEQKNILHSLHKKLAHFLATHLVE